MESQFGLSYSENNNKSEIISEDFLDPLNIDSYDDLLQFRTVLTKKFLGKSKFNFGFHLFDQNSDFVNYTYEFNIDESDNYNFNQNLIKINEYLSTSFAEIDLRIFKKFALNTGIRYENSKLLDKK